MASNGNLEKRDRAEQVSSRRFALPAVDVCENEQAFVLFVDLPGVTNDSLAIQLDKDELVLEGTRKQVEHGAPLEREFAPVDFRRSFVVPRGIDRGQIEAKLRDGVLELRLPKSAELKPRQIQVKSS